MTVLVLRALGIGDLATAVPALRGIRSAWPGHRLKLAAPAWLAPLVPLIGAIDELAVTSGISDTFPSCPCRMWRSISMGGARFPRGCCAG